MKVRVDPLRCGRTGYCVRLLPEVFRLGEGGPAEVLKTPGPELADRVREAETLCPTNAIQVEDTGGVMVLPAGPKIAGGS